jgi:ADP-ribose pyrophosphatase
MAVKPQTVFRTPWFQIATIDPGPEPGGSTEPYYVLLRNNGVIGIVLDEAGRVVLINQYRPPLGRMTLETPAGTVDPGETPEQAMTREILEETGFVCEYLVRVGPCRLMINREDVTDYFFVGLRGRPATGYVRKERGAVRLVERRELRDLVVSRRFEQTIALGGMYMTEKIFGVDLLEDPLAAIETRLVAI